MYSVKDSRFFTVRVSPFGNPRVIAYFQLTAAYRRLSRPSSALSAKAFTLRSFSLEQPFCFFLHSVLQKFETNPAFIAWASQIIVFWVVRSKKTMIFRSYVCFCPPQDFSWSRRNCSHFFCTEKPIRFNNKFFSITTICFVSFLYSVFNEHLVALSASGSTSDMRLSLASLELSTHVGALL